MGCNKLFKSSFFLIQILFDKTVHSVFRSICWILKYWLVNSKSSLDVYTLLYLICEMTKMAKGIEKNVDPFAIKLHQQIFVLMNSSEQEQTVSLYIRHPINPALILWWYLPGQEFLWHSQELNSNHDPTQKSSNKKRFSVSFARHTAFI